MEEENGKVILSFDGHKLTLDERAALALQENVGKSVYLGVRAQDICLADKQQENVIEVQTELYEERENGIVIQFKVDDAMWTALDTEGKTARRGDIARLAINTVSYTHLYHLETGNKRKKVKEDKGAAGEYETSMALEKVKGKKRFIFNAYIPKRNGLSLIHI